MAAKAVEAGCARAIAVEEAAKAPSCGILEGTLPPGFAVSPEYGKHKSYAEQSPPPGNGLGFRPLRIKSDASAANCPRGLDQGATRARAGVLPTLTVRVSCRETVSMTSKACWSGTRA